MSEAYCENKENETIYKGAVNMACQPDGWGTFSSPREKYVGYFRFGLFHGKGTYEYSDGRKRIGTWVDGNFSEGSSYGTTPEGSEVILSGTWVEVNDKYTILNGTGTIHNSDGMKIEFAYKNMKRIESTIYYTNGDTLKGNLNEDERMDGIAIYTYKDGRKKEKIYEDEKFIKDGKMLISAAQIAERKARVAKEKSEREAKAAVERKERQAREAQYAAEQRKAAEVRKKQDIIFNNCILDKSQEVDMDIPKLVKIIETQCREISKNPSRWQRFKYQ